MQGVARFYGIELSSDCWFWLSVDFAKELGWFDEPGTPGVKTHIWTADERFKLVTSVEAINAKRGRGINDAIAILKKRYPEYRNIRGLSTRYYEAKRRLEPPPGSLWDKLKKDYGN